MQVASNESCLAHLSDDERHQALNELVPGADIDVRGTSFTKQLLDTLLQALNDPVANRPRIGYARFDGVVFDGHAEFRNVIFDRDAEFDHAKFNYTASFAGSEFRGTARFQGALFSTEADFTESEFNVNALFAKAEFHQHASFHCRFGGNAGFGPDQMFSEGAKFFGTADFGGARFDGDALFGGKRALGAVSASVNAPLADRSRISNYVEGATKFEADARFNDAVFSGRAAFQGTYFRGDTGFLRARFKRSAQFSDCGFGGKVQFSTAKFAEYAGFSRVRFEASARFDETEFEKRADFGAAAFLDDEVILGPCIAQELIISEARIGLGFRVVCRCEQVEACNVHCPKGLCLQLDGDVHVNAPEIHSPTALTLIYQQTQLTLRDAFFGTPTTISASKLTGADDTAVFSQPQVAPQLLGLQRVDSTNLTLVGLDLSLCRFIDCYNRDRLRIDGPMQFAPSPLGRRWTRRQTLAEEHYWRARYDRHPEGWSPTSGRDSGEEQPPQTDHEHTSTARSEAAQIQAVYRDLRKGREDAKDEPGAADFYYGEMEMRRFAAHPYSVERALLTLYWMIAGYGLRATRAVAALILVLLLGTVGFATVGLAPSAHVEYYPVTTNAANRPAVYQQVTVPGTRPGWSGALDQSLDSATSLLRQNAQLPLTAIGRAFEIALRLLGPLLLGFVILALRGRVKR